MREWKRQDAAQARRYAEPGGQGQDAARARRCAEPGGQAQDAAQARRYAEPGMARVVTANHYD